MAETKATRLADLRRQKRDIEKAIRAEQGTARMEKDFAQQKSLTELKEKLEKQLQSHPLGKGKTLKWLLKQPDYYTYANGAHKGNSLDDLWVKQSLSGGWTESKLIEHANKTRVTAWQRADRARKRKKKPKTAQPHKPVQNKVKGTDTTKVRGIG